MITRTFVSRLSSTLCLLVLLAACGVPATGSTSTNQQTPAPTTPDSTAPGAAETPPAVLPDATEPPAAVTPDAVEAAPTKTPEPAATAPAVTPDASTGTDLAGGSWQLVEYGPADSLIAVVPGSNATIIFEPGGKIGGSASCNSYFGTYQLDGQSFTVGEVGSTMMACMDDNVMQQETAYLTALQAATALQQDGDKLTIDYAGGVLHFTKVVPDAASSLEGTNWQLESFVNGDSVSSTVAGSNVTAEFADGKVAGSAGCNQYSADYTLADGTLSVGPVVSTKMACDAAIMGQEQQVVNALGTATTLLIDGDRLRLEYPGGALIFRAASSYATGTARPSQTMVNREL